MTPKQISERSVLLIAEDTEADRGLVRITYPGSLMVEYVGIILSRWPEVVSFRPINKYVKVRKV